LRVIGGVSFELDAALCIYNPLAMPIRLGAGKSEVEGREMVGGRTSISLAVGGRRVLAMLAGTLLLGGCASSGAPAVPVFGAFFPAWLIATISGVIAAIVLRVGLAVSGLDEVVPWLLAVCSSAGLIVAVAVSALLFG
jgi:hypothetical protein